MRVTELMESDYNQDLRSEVITLLTAISAEGINEIDTQNLLNDLEQQGFAIDEQTLLDVLNNIEIVSTATADTISIATSDADALVGDDAEEIKKDKVDDLATDQATKDLGEDAGPKFRHGDPIIDSKGETGDVYGKENDGKIRVAYYNNPDPHYPWVDVDELEHNDYANSDEEENDLRLAMGDEDYDRMHGDFGYEESIDRMRQLAGTAKE